MNTVHNIKVETDMLNRKFPCSLCIYTTRNINKLRSHLMNAHNKEEHNWMVEDITAVFSCDDCDLEFSRRSELSLHLDSVHSGDQGNSEKIKEVKFKEDEAIKKKEEKEEVFQPYTVILPAETKANHWTEAKAKVVDEAEVLLKDVEKVVKLNYVLDEFKNMKVAKANAKKPMAIHRIEKDTVNIRYKLNSAAYLVLKAEFDKMEKGYTWVDNDNKVKMYIDKKPQYEEDKAGNNPKTVIKWKVEDENNKFESSVTVNL